LPAGAGGPAEARLAAWRGDATGTSWTVSEVDAALANQSVADVAERDGLLVAIGNEHSGCRSSDDQPLGRQCSTSAARALWSDDGGASWHGAGAAPGVQGTLAQTVVATADGFLAAGRDEVDGSSWQLVVWASADGTNWREVARFSDPEWPLYEPDLEIVGETVLLLGQRAVCSEPHLNGDYWVLGSPFFRQSRVWSAGSAGTSWTELDLVSLGLADGLPSTMDCDAGSGSQQGAEVSLTGSFQPGDDRAIWSSAVGLWTSDDGVTWDRVGDPGVTPPSSLFWRVPGGWANVTFQSKASALVVSARTSTDLVTWTNQSEFSPTLPVVVPPERSRSGAGLPVKSVAASDAVVVAVGHDLIGSAGEQAAFYRSVATAVMAPAASDCEPAAGFVCPRGDLSGAELAGLDLSGAELESANLRRANLTGANLSGANLVAADLSNADLTGANLTGARLARANMRSAVVDGANFANADLRDVSSVEPVGTATWTGALMHGVNLSDLVSDAGPWDLSGIDLTGASIRLDQSGVSLAGAVLRGALLSGSYVDSDFTGADLRDGASFSSADLTGAKFADAVWDETTGWYPETCPDGFEPPMTFPATDCTGHFIDR
jgi:uncharacterized protein YjbI with pentapeptide repeats